MKVDDMALADLEDWAARVDTFLERTDIRDNARANQERVRVWLDQAISRKCGAA